MGCTKWSTLKLFHIPTPSLSHSCVSCVHEAPGSVRYQKGNIWNSSAPPGQAVLTGCWFVRCTQWGCAKNIDMGAQDRREGGEGKKCISPVLARRPHTVSFEGRFTLFHCTVCGPAWSTPPSTVLHPHPCIYGPSKDYCLLLSEATSEININLTSDHMLWAPRLR